MKSCFCHSVCRCISLIHMNALIFCASPRSRVQSSPQRWGRICQIFILDECFILSFYCPSVWVLDHVFFDGYWVVLVLRFSRVCRQFRDYNGGWAFTHGHLWALGIYCERGKWSAWAESAPLHGMSYAWLWLSPLFDGLDIRSSAPAYSTTAMTYFFSCWLADSSLDLDDLRSCVNEKGKQNDYSLWIWILSLSNQKPSEMRWISVSVSSICKLAQIAGQLFPHQKLWEFTCRWILLGILPGWGKGYVLRDFSSFDRNWAFERGMVSGDGYRVHCTLSLQPFTGIHCLIKIMFVFSFHKWPVRIMIVLITSISSVLEYLTWIPRYEIFHGAYQETWSSAEHKWIIITCGH